MLLLTKEEFDALYSPATPVGLYNQLKQKAQERLDYIIEFIEYHYFNDNIEYPLVFTNSIASYYGIISRETNGDKGHFEPSECIDKIVLVPQVEETDNTEYPEHKFTLIDIQKYQIELDPSILYSDFEQEFHDYLKEHGSPLDRLKAEQKKEREEFILELKKFRDTLTTEQERLIHNFSSFERWKQLKQYAKFYK